ncbi:unnamed protein product [Calypogeia fissa]
MMDSNTTESASSSLDDLELSDPSNEDEDEAEEEERNSIEYQFTSLAVESTPQQQQHAQLQPSDSSSDIGQPTTQVSLTTSLSLATPTSQIGASQARGRSLRNRHLRGRQIHLTTPSGDHIREVLHRRPRCGLQVLRSLRHDRQYCVPEPRGDPEKPQRQPGKIDQLFTPKDGDLLLHHVKKPAKRVVEFFDAEKPPPFEEGDYLLRFKVENYSFLQQSFVTTRGYLYHHGNWVYLGKDADQMQLA